MAGQQKRSSGANYLLADLHLHTPADPKFQCAPGTVLNTESGRRDFARSYVEAALSKKLSVIGITDHNKLEYVDYIREAAKDTSLTVFPGFELSANSGSQGVHLICLFDPDRPKEEIEDIITQFGLPRTARVFNDGNNKIATKTLDEILEFVQDASGGIVIAAHMNSDCGIIKSMEGAVRVSAWTNPKLIAGELPKARSSYDREETFVASLVKNRADNYRRNRPIACIYSSDARSLDEIGRNPTWIKLSSKTVEGLRQAFLDYESRVRHPSELPEYSYTKIVGIKWVGGFLDGLGIRFNKNLNCLIGGKGTGKSTIIETIRFGLDLSPIGVELTKQHKSIISDVFKSGSTLKMLIECHKPSPEHYLIERAYPSAPVIYRWDNKNSQQGEQVQGLKPEHIISGLEVYGQKEILELSRDEAIQLELLSRFLEDEKILQLEKAQNDITEKLNQNKKRLLELKDSKERKESFEKELLVLDEKLKQYEKLGLRDKLSEKSAYTTEEVKYKYIFEELKRIENELASVSLTASVNLDRLNDNEISSLPNVSLLIQARTELENLNGTMGDVIRSGKEAVEKTRERVSQSYGQWKTKDGEQESRYNQLLRELQTDTIDPNEFIKIQRRKVELEPLIADLKTKEVTEAGLKTQRIALLNDLQSVRREEFQEFTKAAEYINEQLAGTLRVTLFYQGNRQECSNVLSNIKSGARADQIKKLVEHPEFNYITLCEKMRLGADSLSQHYEITQTAAANLIEKIGTRDQYDYETMKIPPSIKVELNIDSKENPQYRETSHLSIGQKCTAILLIILLRSKYPLIVDQPEDDLDNSFVYRDIVQRLRREKECRQFIIATHNANIPVLGDAELIQVLHAEKGKIKLDECHQGSIDDPDIKKAAKEILEGGHAAFELRKAKYGFD